MVTEMMSEVMVSGLLQTAPSLLSVVLLWKIKSLESEVYRLRDLHIRHLEFHSEVVDTQNQNC